MLAPLYHEECIEAGDGKVFLKIFVDRAHSRAYVLALSERPVSDCSRNLSKKILGAIKARKVSATCLLDNPEALDAVSERIRCFASSVFLG